MGRLLTLDDLQKQFDLARDQLSLAREELFAITPLPEGFSRDAYGFSYLRAERIGMGVITQSLKEISWLPMQLDPQAEIVLGNKRAIKKWLGSSSVAQPNGAVFGNDFIHALTRVALTEGWQSHEFRITALRIGRLFHDLSCLIGLIYYGVWMAENGIASVPITDFSDLERTAREVSFLTRSPEVAQILSQRKRARDEAKANKKKAGPTLRVIENADWGRNTPPPAS